MTGEIRPRSPQPPPNSAPPPAATRHGRVLWRPTELEASFEDAVIPLLIHHHFLVHHSRPALTNKGYRTALKGHQGCPDLTIAKGGFVWLVELKRDTTKPDGNQERWLAAAGPMGAVWRPRDMPWIRVWAANPFEQAAA